MRSTLVLVLLVAFVAYVSSDAEPRACTNTQCAQFCKDSKFVGGSMSGNACVCGGGQGTCVQSKCNNFCKSTCKMRAGNCFDVMCACS